jgi:methionine synthase II (cobalamin-independent)
MSRYMVTRDSIVEDIVRECPEMIGPLARFGLVCISCGEPVWGTLGELAERKGIRNLNDIIQQINKKITNKNKFD